MVTHPLERRPEKYAEELANDPQFIAEGWAVQVTDQLLELLEQRGLTQAWLAEEMGVSRAHISKIMKAQPNFTFLSLARIAVALGVEVLPPRLTAKPAPGRVGNGLSRLEDKGADWPEVNSDGPVLKPSVADLNVAR